MNRLNELRKIIGDLVHRRDKNPLIRLTLDEAQGLVKEFEDNHGGNCELSNYRVRIADLTEKVKSLTEQLIDTKRKLAMKPEDRASSILE